MQEARSGVYAERCAMFHERGELGNASVPKAPTRTIKLMISAPRFDIDKWMNVPRQSRRKRHIDNVTSKGQFIRNTRIGLQMCFNLSYARF